MEKTRVLYVSHEITPYLDETPMSLVSRHLPKGIQDKGKEIRTFMPRFGCINERRNQLHEVIRLSGMNLIINDTDHPLIIKVASIPAARMQVYFIDNEDYFHRKFRLHNEKGEFYKDNEERAIFFCRGVIETVKKLGWTPDVIHCHGWMAAFLPLYLKTSYKDNPVFNNTKIMYSLYNDGFSDKFPKGIENKVMHEGVSEKDIVNLKSADYKGVMKTAIDFSDAFGYGEETLDTELVEYVKNKKKPILEYQDSDSFIDAHNEFYDNLIK